MYPNKRSVLMMDTSSHPGRYILDKKGVSGQEPSEHFIPIGFSTKPQSEQEKSYRVLIDQGSKRH